MVGRVPKFLGALKVVPKLVASGSGKKTGRGGRRRLNKNFCSKKSTTFREGKLVVGRKVYFWHTGSREPVQKNIKSNKNKIFFRTIKQN